MTKLIAFCVLLITSSWAVQLLHPGEIPVGVFLDQQSNFASELDQIFKDIQKELGVYYRLVPRVAVVNTSSSFSHRSQVCDVLQQGVFVTLSTESFPSGYNTLSVVETLHMPYISISDQDIQQQNSQYKIWMTPSYVEVLFSLQKFYHWEHVFYLYSDNAGLSRFEKFQRLLNVHSQTVELDMRYIDPRLTDSYDVLRNLDKKYTQSSNKKTFNEKVLILDLTSDQLTQKLIDQLVDVGMTRDYYHIVPATLSINSLNLEHLMYGGATVTGFQLNGLSGYTDLKKQLAIDSLTLIYKALQYIPNRDRQFQPFYRRGEIHNGDIIGTPCYAFENSWKLGPLIMNALRQTSFEGRSGLVKFNTSAYRVGYNFDILQQTRMSKLKKVGDWSDETGLDEWSDIRPMKNATIPETGFFNETFYITTVLVAPYAMKTNNNGYEGYAIDLAKELSKAVGFKYEIHVAKDGAHGKLHSNGTWDGMIGELIDGTADIAIADLTITSERESAVDFSTPFMNLGISIMIRKPEKQKPSVFSFMDPLSNNVWICIALSFTGVSIVMYIISRVSPNEWKVQETPDGEETVENEFTAQNSAWFVAGALMCQGSELSPIAPSNRVVGSSWWLFTLIIMSSYTANLAAFLTVENIVTPIKTIQDLANHPTIKFGTMDSGTTRAFFENSSTELFSMMWDKMKVDADSLLMPNASAGISKVRSSKGGYAFLFESTTNEYANQRKPCNTIKVGENLDSKNYGVATRQGHKLRHKITLAILRMHERGILNKLKQTWWYDKGQCADDGGSSSIKALSLSNVAGVFYILIGGLLIAMLCALLEFVVKSVQDAKKFKKSLRESMKSKARMSIAGESDDSPFYYLPRPSYRISVDSPINN